MARRTNDNPINENWIKGTTIKHMKTTAKQVLEQVKKQEANQKFIYVKVSDLPRTFKRVLIK